MTSVVAAPIAFVLAALLASQCTDAYIGMNWGRQSAQLLVPSQVVDLVMQNGIRHVRIYTTQTAIMDAFRGSGIALTITFFDVPRNLTHARRWIQDKYNPLNLNNITSAIIGGGVYPFNWGSPDVPDYDLLWRSLNYVQTALNEAGLGEQIKTNFIHYSGVLITNITKPSEAEFRPEIRDKLMEFLQHLRENDAPFMVDIFPISDLERCGLHDHTFAFPDNKSKLVINDVSGAVYRNGFDWQYDCFVWALEKMNASDIKIVVMGVGWPTDGYEGANLANAERFFRYLLPMVASNKGTPKRPGAPIDVYINSLSDEPKITAKLPPFMRHWGIYRSNGEPKFKIDLSGRGRDIYPTEAKGIMRMPERWCVFNGYSMDIKKVQRQMDLACAKGDCTTLAPKASCSNLGFRENVSYAFNVYFQTLYQTEDACDFEGLGVITDEDPSIDECVFPVEVVKGNVLYGPSGAPAHRRSILVFVVFLFIMVGLI